MKCWKCGKENADGAAFCAYCSAKLARPEPVSPSGIALRKIYDRFGAEQVFTNSSLLSAALGDMMEDSQKLSRQLRFAMDAGIGRIYLHQVQNIGQPDNEFTQKIKILLTQEAGLSSTTADELMGCLDEMIGWTELPEAQQNQSEPSEEPQYGAAPNGELYRDQPQECSQPDPKPTGEGKTVLAVFSTEKRVPVNGMISFDITVTAPSVHTGDPIQLLTADGQFYDASIRMMRKGISACTEASSQEAVTIFCEAPTEIADKTYSIFLLSSGSPAPAAPAAEQSRPPIQNPPDEIIKPIKSGIGPLAAAIGLIALGILVGIFSPVAGCLLAAVGVLTWFSAVSPDNDTET